MMKNAEPSISSTRRFWRGEMPGRSVHQQRYPLPRETASSPLDANLALAHNIHHSDLRSMVRAVVTSRRAGLKPDRKAGLSRPIVTFLLCFGIRLV